MIQAWIRRSASPMCSRSRWLNQPSTCGSAGSSRSPWPAWACGWRPRRLLPKARDRAKDLGIINIAIVCPGATGALIAAPLVSLAGYSALFGATAVVAFAAAIGVWKIKSVRCAPPGQRSRDTGLALFRGFLVRMP
jgi:hypothetical protein